MEPIASQSALSSEGRGPGPRRPLAGLACLFLLGTIAGFAWRVPATPALCLAAASLAVAALCARWARAGIAVIALHAAVLVLAFAAVRVRQEPWETGVSRLEGRRMELVGVVTGEPELLRPRTRAPRAVRFPLRVESGMPSASVPAATVMVHLSQTEDPAWKRPSYGDRWRCAGEFAVSRRSGVAPGRCRFVCRAEDAARISGGHGVSGVGWVYQARRRAAALLAVGIEDFPSSVGLVQSMLLGYRARMSWRAQDLFVETGTLHIFAISGLHVVILAGLITFLLNAVRISREYWFFFLLPLLVGYTVAVGAMASAVRACVMSAACALAPLLGRKPDYASALALAAVAVLAGAPDQAFDPGFVLSFGVVAGLLVFTPCIQAPLARLWQPDPLRVTPEAWWIAMLRALWQKTVSLFAMSTAAWIVSTPMMLYYFGRFTPVALVSNLIIVPLSFVVVLAGCLSISLGACCECLADILNHANLAVVFVLLKVARWMAMVPLGNVECGKVSAWAVLFSYVLLAGIAVKARIRTVDMSPTE